MTIMPYGLVQSMLESIIVPIFSAKILAKKFIAFTLAETLIVMGVIGIVAALTIPNLNGKTNDVEKVAKLRKVYANLSEAYERATVVYGPITGWKTSCPVTDNNVCFTNRLTEFMKVSKVCGAVYTSNGCINSPYKNPINDISAISGSGEYSFLLADGTGVSVGAYYSGTSISFDCNQVVNGFKACGKIVVDIDGPNKGKQKEGVDAFAFEITKDSITPWGSTKDGNTGWMWNSYCGSQYFMMSCAAWVIENGNLDYLIATEDGSNGLKCPNGKILGWNTASGQVTSCK